MVLQLTLKAMSKAWLMSNWTMLYSYSYFLPILYGPLVWLFIEYKLTPVPFRKKDLCHFFPAAFVLLLIMLDSLSILPDAMAMVIFHPLSRLSIILLSLFTYHYMAVSRVKRNNGNRSVLVTGAESVIQLNWMKQFVILSLVITGSIAIATYFLYVFYPLGQQFRFAFLLLSLFIYWISYVAMQEPIVFDVLKGYGKDEGKESEPANLLTFYRQNEKYANSTLTEEEARTINHRLNELVLKEKFYLNPQYNINQLADVLHCSRHHLSQVLNDKMKLSYNEYINGLRLEEARKLLIQPQLRGYKISSVAYDAGFNSLSTFNDVFKKHTGKTPSEYRKEMLKEEKMQRV
jgi:AraC-like DNA-binding protein